MDLLLETERLPISTEGDCQVVDITDELLGLVRLHGLREGQVLVFVPGSTGGLTTVEYEPGLVRDLQELFDRMVPRGARYHHDDTWHDGNGHAHCRASLLGASIVVPVERGALALGTWQQVIFVDFDNRPRERSLVVQLLGRAG